MVEENGDNLIVVSAGANGALVPEHLKAAAEAIEKTDILLLQLEVPLLTVRAGLKIGRKFKKRTILNPAPYVSGVEEMLPLVDVFTPNQPEAAAMTGSNISTVSEAEAAAQNILQKGASEVIITLGSEGCFVATQHTTKYLAAYAIKQVVDTSGAGDVFNGALAGALSDGANLVEAADFASACAALSVTKATASNCAPLQAEALAFRQAIT
jgi:ribokinase